MTWCGKKARPIINHGVGDRAPLEIARIHAYIGEASGGADVALVPPKFLES